MEEKKEEVLIVSPHPDDACFALGGMLLKEKNRHFYIWDIFNVQSFSILNEDSDKAMKRIMDEEKCFLYKVQGVGIIEDIKEASLRGYDSLKRILFNDKKPIYDKEENKEIYNRLARRIKEIITEINPKRVYLPMGVGGHIDHLIVRDAVISVIEGFPNIEFYFYEEMPYSVNQRWVGKALENAWNKEKLLPILVEIDDYIDKKKN